MPDRLPPLTALRAFDAAARHMSFAKAADELNVTPAALSFQIKSLEDHLGTPVFRRLNRAVELTEAGMALAPGAQDGFDALTRAWRAARRSMDTGTLTVTAGPAFTAKWLAPRLYAFAQANPEIELRLSASLKLMSFDRDDIDVAIRFGYGPDHGLFSSPLMRDFMTPVMSPTLAQTYKTPSDLLTAPILIDESVLFLDPPSDWAAWFKANDLPATELHGLHFSQADHAIDAAQAGAGVLLARMSLAAKAISDGLLVAPFPIGIGTEAHFRFLCPKGAETRPHVAAFRTWIEDEVTKQRAITPDKTIIPAAALV